ncbi:response regulator transcription factor [Olivibacter sitiensis]|uniref:response regulator transcription factor n=1 Tax=Olivibacter sitiensis TaxID=376470 RepID=UPI0004805F30|nr:response regulator transcription factor [Olivibacter sitiensis]
MNSILFAEDEEDLALIVKDNLEEAGFDVLHVSDGDQVLDAFRRMQPALVILDVMMPGMDGFTAASLIRKENFSVPILFLTARTSTDDVVNAFHIGANDYLRKPFSMQELVVRVTALAKRANERTSKAPSSKINIGSYELDPVRQQLIGHGQTFNLSYREAVLLEMLSKHKNELLPRENIINTVWPNDRFFNGRSLDVYISRLRQYMKEDERIAILNIRAKGYKLMIDEM